MKDAQPKDEQTQTRQPRSKQQNDFRAKPRPVREVNFGAIVQRILYFLVWIITLPIRLYEFLTRPPGSSILFGLGSVYMILLSVESYAQAGGLSIAFVPKFGIDDGGNFTNLLPAMGTAISYPALVVSMIVTSVQAWLLRDISPNLARAQYQQVQHHKVPNSDPNAIDIVEIRRRRYIGSGTRTERIKGVVLLGTYAIDILTSYSNYPLLGLSIGRMFINLIYFLFAIGGSEVCINLFRDSIDEAKAQPQVEMM